MAAQPGGRGEGALRDKLGASTRFHTAWWIQNGTPGVGDGRTRTTSAITRFLAAYCQKGVFWHDEQMPKAQTRVALYARVSTKDKRQDTENQLAQLRQFCETQNWTVVHEYVDRATGKHSDREQFQRLFADASQRKFDVVLFWSWTALAGKAYGKR